MMSRTLKWSGSFKWSNYKPRDLGCYEALRRRSRMIAAFPSCGPRHLGRLAARTCYGSFKPDPAETPWQMEIQFIDGRPGSPMRMRVLLGTLVEISPPDLA